MPASKLPGGVRRAFRVSKKSFYAGSSCRFRALGALRAAILCSSASEFAPAGAVARTTVCRMDYTLKGWSAFYKTSKESVSLALAGKGTGVEPGVSFGKFTITRW